MPNHVVNEVIFRDITDEQRSLILAIVLGTDGKVDFSTLVPMPLNMWWGSVGTKEEKAFKQTGLDWARENWGTKWNAYSQHEIEQEHGRLTLIFETAWRPPYGWLAALLNKLALSFDHNWHDEGAEIGRVGRFERDDGEWGPKWSEQDAEGEMQRHLHKLQWGVETTEELAQS